MGFACDCDYGGTFYAQTYPKARKIHVCHECREPILPGDIYAKAVGVFDGDFMTHKACERCGDLISSFEALGFCWSWGYFLVDYRDWLQECEIEYPDWLCQVMKIGKWKQELKQ